MVTLSQHKRDSAAQTEKWSGPNPGLERVSRPSPCREIATLTNRCPKREKITRTQSRENTYGKKISRSHDLGEHSCTWNENPKL